MDLFDTDDVRQRLVLAGWRQTNYFGEARWRQPKPDGTPDPEGGVYSFAAAVAKLGEAGRSIESDMRE